MFNLFKMFNFKLKKIIKIIKSKNDKIEHFKSLKWFKPCVHRIILKE